jgi:hypothetical protein
MQIRIVTIDVQLTPRAKRAIAWFALPVAVFAGSITVARATLSPAPSSWVQSGQPVVATDLANSLNQLDQRTPGVYCGATTNSYTGNLNGYGNADSLCGGVAGCSSAHMCTAQELVRSAASGKTIPVGWYSTGEEHSDNTGTYVDDCDGWTNGTSSTTAGAQWDTHASAAVCTSQNEVLCCN